MNWKKILAPILLILCFFMLTGMSGLGGAEGPTRIPTPEKNFSVTIIDMADVHTKATMFTIGGYTHFFGRKGKGQLAVPFEKIKRVDFSMKPNGLKVLIRLRDGNSVMLSASKSQECFGKTPLGNFKIVMEDIKTIKFGERISKPVAANK